MSGTSGAAFWRRATTIRLAGVPGLGLPRAPQWAEPVWHLYVVRTDRRAELMKALDAAGIGSLIHYPIPPHLQQAYADLGLPQGIVPAGGDARRHGAQPADRAAYAGRVGRSDRRCRPLVSRGKRHEKTRP